MVQSELARLSGNERAPPQAGAEPAAAAAPPAAEAEPAVAELAADAADGEEAAGQRFAAIVAEELEADAAQAGAAWQVSEQGAAHTGAGPDAPALQPAAAGHEALPGSPDSTSDASAPARSRSPSPRPASHQERQKLQEAAARAAAAAAAAAARLQKAAALARGTAPTSAAPLQPPQQQLQALLEEQPEQGRAEEGHAPLHEAGEVLPAQQPAEIEAAAAEAPPTAAPAAAAGAAARGDAPAAPIPEPQASADDGVVVFSFDAGAALPSAQELAQQRVASLLPPEAAAALQRRLRPALPQSNGLSGSGGSATDNGAARSGSASEAAPPAPDASPPASSGAPPRDVQASAVGRGGRSVRRGTARVLSSRSGSAARRAGGGIMAAAPPAPTQRSRRAGLARSVRGASRGLSLEASPAAGGKGEEEAQQAQQAPQQQQVKAGGVSVPAQVPPPPAAEAPPSAPPGPSADSGGPPTRPPPAVAPASPTAAATPLAPLPTEPQAQPDGEQEMLRLFDVSSEPPPPAPRQARQHGESGEVLRLFEPGSAGSGALSGGPPRRLPLSWSLPAGPGWALEDDAFSRPSTPREWQSLHHGGSASLAPRRRL